MNPNPNFTIHPGMDEARIQDAIKALKQGREDEAKIFAMTAGVNAAHLGNHDLPPVLAQNADLASEWHWGHKIELKGISERNGEPQGRLL